MGIAMRKINYMKYILPILTAILFLIACNDNKPTEEKRIGGYVPEDTIEQSKVTLITSVQEEIAMKRKPRPPQPPTTIDYDKDDDGVPDSTDSCPTVIGSQLNNGCPIVVVTPPTPTVDTGWKELWMPPAITQKYGECAAFAIGYDARSSRWFETTGAKLTFSPAFDFYFAKMVFDSTQPCSGGTSMQLALDVIVNKGICTLNSMPFTGDCKIAPTPSQLTEALQYKISGYSKIAKTDTSAIKAMIDQGKAVIVSMSVDSYFLNAKPGSIWMTYLGPSIPHAFTIFGYNSQKHLFKIINSQGTTWGDNGTLRMSMDIIYNNAGSYVYVIN